LVAVCGLRPFGIGLSTDDSLVFEAVGAEGEGLAAGKAAAVQHGHDPSLLHFSNNMHLVCAWCLIAADRRFTALLPRVIMEVAHDGQDTG
jgi:hypothetical protein